MRWIVLAALVVCSCGKKAPEVSALQRTHARGGMNAAMWTDRNGENRVVFSALVRLDVVDDGTMAGMFRRSGA